MTSVLRPRLTIAATRPRAALLCQSAIFYELLADAVEQRALSIELVVTGGSLTTQDLAQACSRILPTFCPPRDIFSLRIKVEVELGNTRPIMQLQWTTQDSPDARGKLYDWFRACKRKQEQHGASSIGLSAVYRALAPFYAPSRIAERTKDEEEKTASTNPCVICLERPSCYAVVPCKHAVYCDLCVVDAERIEKCSLCRLQIDSVVDLTKRRP